MNNMMNENVIEQQAERYFDQYRDHIDTLMSESIIAKNGGSVSSMDVYALGKQLEQYEEYQQFVENQNGGTLANMGQIPNVALDVITATNATSIMPLLASIQAIPEERGLVYHKKIIAQTTQGGFTKGQTINHPHDGSLIANSESFGSGHNSTTFATTVDGQQSYSSTMGVPVRPHTVKLYLADGGTLYEGQDNGQGVLMGTNGMFGTVDYSNGAVVLQFVNAPAADLEVVIEFEADLEAQDDITAISTGLDTTNIDAEVFALKAESGILMEFSFQKRFGRSAEDEVASDLTSEMTRVLNTRAIKQLARSATGNTTWIATPPTGVSYKDHKDTFLDVISAAEAKLAQNAGRGSINRMVAGTTAASILRSMPGFQALPSGTEHQVGLYGYLDGVPVIRATNVLPDKEIICVYRGKGYFEAPLVYAPYMPLFVSDTMQVTKNPLRHQRVAAVWAGITPVIKTFVTKITIDNTSENSGRTVV